MIYLSIRRESWPLNHYNYSRHNRKYIANERHNVCLDLRSRSHKGCPRPAMVYHSILERRCGILEHTTYIFVVTAEEYFFQFSNSLLILAIFQF